MIYYGCPYCPIYHMGISNVPMYYDILWHVLYGQRILMANLDMSELLLLQIFQTIQESQDLDYYQLLDSDHQYHYLHIPQQSYLHHQCNHHIHYQ